MKKLFLLLLLILNLTNVICQSLQRKNGESAEEFVVRTMTNATSKITGKVLETKWNSKTVLFAFIAVEAANEKYTTTTIYGYVLIPIGENIYQKVYIDSYEEEGAVAEIDAVLFANADKDKQKELVVLCSWNQDRHAYPISGNLYQVYFYDDLHSKKLPEVLTKIKLEKSFPPEFNGTNDEGKKSKANYTNAAKIKQKLKQLGF